MNHIAYWLGLETRDSTDRKFSFKFNVRMPRRVIRIQYHQALKAVANESNRLISDTRDLCKDNRHHFLRRAEPKTEISPSIQRPYIQIFCKFHRDEIPLIIFCSNTVLCVITIVG